MDEEEEHGVYQIRTRPVPGPTDFRSLLDSGSSPVSNPESETSRLPQ
jgi:hypothetical protein